MRARMIIAICVGFAGASCTGGFSSSGGRDGGLRDGGARDARELPLDGPLSDSGSTDATLDSSIPVDAGPFVVRPSGSDDTAALIAAVSAHDTVVIDQPLTINGIVDLTGMSNKTIEWTGAGELNRPVESTEGTWQVLIIKDATNVHLINPIINGPSPTCAYIPAIEHHHAIQITNAGFITIDGGHLRNVGGDGIYISGRNPVSHDITFNDLEITCVGRASIADVSSNGVRVNRGAFRSAGLWIFNIEPVNSGSVMNYYADRPIVGESGWPWLNSSGPDFSCMVSNITFNMPTFERANRSTGLAACAVPNITIL